MSSMNDFFNMMMQLSQRTNAYTGGKNGQYNAQSGTPFWEGFADGVNARNMYMRENQANADRKRQQEREDMFYKNLPYGQDQQGAIPQGIGANENGVFGMGQQEAPRFTEGKSVGFGDLFGGEGSVLNFRNPSSDNAPTVAGTALSGAPNYLDDKYRIDNWIAADRDGGVTNPLISAIRHQAFIEPLRQQARQDMLKEKFRIAYDPNSTPEQKQQALALLSGELGKDLIGDQQWRDMQRNQQMKQWRWADEERPYKMQGLKLGNALKDFRLRAAMGLGIENPESYMGEDGFININTGTSSKKKNGTSSYNRDALVSASSALAKSGIAFKDAAKAARGDMVDENTKKAYKTAETDFRTKQNAYVEQLTPYINSRQFGGDFDGLANLYRFMNQNDKSGLDPMELSESIAIAAHKRYPQYSVNDIQNEIISRVNSRDKLQVAANFDALPSTMWDDVLGNLPYIKQKWDKEHPEQAKINAVDENAILTNAQQHGYNGASQPSEVSGNSQALPPINRESVTNPIERVRGGGWGASLKKKEIGMSNPFVDNMRALQGWYPFRWNDGTNCMRAISTALEGTPYGMDANGGKPLYNVDQAVAIARELGQLKDPRTYTPRAGDIVVTNYSDTTGHVGMVTENGGVIQNGSSGDEVALNVTDKYGRRGGSVYETEIPVNQLHDDIAFYISTSDYLT